MFNVKPDITYGAGHAGGLFFQWAISGTREILGCIAVPEVVEPASKRGSGKQWQSGNSRGGCSSDSVPLAEALAQQAIRGAPERSRRMACFRHLFEWFTNTH